MFRSLVENSPDIIARYDRDCRRTYVNPVYLKVAQIPQQQLLGTSPIHRSPLPATSAAVLQNLLRKVLDSGVAEAADVIWPKADNIDYWYNIYAFPEFNREGRVVSVMTISRDITERKRAEEERLAHLRFFESMDRVNRAVQGTNGLEQLMSDVLDTLLSILECDRAWLVYPCDLKAASWRPLMERTRLEYPGTLAQGLEIPMDTEVLRVFRTVRTADGPVPFGPGFEHPLPEGTMEQFGIQSMLSMAIYPKADKPYMFGLHQCSYPRIWTAEEKRLFQEVGRRLSDALSSHLVS